MKLNHKMVIGVMLALAVSAMSACSAADAAGSQAEEPVSTAAASDTASAQEAEIVFWPIWANDSPTGQFLLKVADRFMEENPGVTVTIEGQNGYDGTAEKIEAAVAANQTPTLSGIEETFIGRFAPIAEDVSKYIPQEVIDNYQEGLLTSSYVDGVMKAVPFNRSTPILYLNLDLVRAAGLPETGPETWADFEQYAQAMTDPENGVYGASGIFDVDAWIWESMVYSMGGQMISEDNQTVLFADTSAGSDIVALFQKMADAGTLFNPYIYQGDSFDTMGTKFAEGKVGMLINSIACYADYRTYAEEAGFELGLAFQPRGEENEFSVATGGGNIMMFSAAPEEDKQAAGQFLALLASDEYAAEYSQLSGYFPVTKSALEHPIMQELLAERPDYQVAIDQLQYAHKRPLTQHWKQMYTVIVDELESCMVDTSKDPVATVHSAAESCQKMIDEG